MLTTKQAAQRLNVTTQTIRRWLKSGRLEGRQVMKPRGKIQITEASVARLEAREDTDT